MFKWFFKKIMAFKANNVEIQGKKVPSEEGTPSLPLEGLRLSKTETELLLHTLKNTTFKGEMVEVLFILVGKLKNNLKQYE
jgi:hypothetical protein